VTLQDAVYILRTRWITIVVLTVVTTVIAVAYAWLATPTYTASTRIFIATRDATTGQDAYAAGQLAQGRTIAYKELIMSESLATRTVKRLKLNIAPRDLAKKVDASAKTDSVLITLSVTDSSGSAAVGLANALSEDFVSMVQDLETPAPGGPPALRAVIVQPAADPKWVSPQRPKIISFGVLAGLLLGATVALLRGRPAEGDRGDDEATIAAPTGLADAKKDE
jgi:capsular polysaccharide biosynthesis protein